MEFYGNGDVTAVCLCNSSVCAVLNCTCTDQHVVVNEDQCLQ